MKYKKHTKNSRDVARYVSTMHYSLFHLFLICLQSGDKALFHAIGGVGGTTDGIDLFVEGFVGGQTVPGFVKTAVHNALGKVGCFLVLQQNDILDASISIQSY